MGIRRPLLHSVACLCSRGSQVAIEFGLGRRIRGDAGTINFSDVADIKRAGLPVQGPVSYSGWDMGGVGLSAQRPLEVESGDYRTFIDHYRLYSAYR